MPRYFLMAIPSRPPSQPFAFHFWLWRRGRQGCRQSPLFWKKCRNACPQKWIYSHWHSSFEMLRDAAKIPIYRLIGSFASKNQSKSFIFALLVPSSSSNSKRRRLLFFQELCEKGPGTLNWSFSSKWLWKRGCRSAEAVRWTMLETFTFVQNSVT